MFEPVMRGRFDAYVQCLLLPRPLVDIIGPWDESLPRSQDLDYMFRTAEHARARGDETPVYLYRRHPQSVSMQQSQGDDPWLSVHERHYARHPEHRGTRVERWLEAAYAMGEVVQHWDGRALVPFSRSLARALLLSPRDAWYHARTEVRHRLMRRRTRQSDP
jgi:hypothetical protein